jgi:hypothetical protein
MGGNQRYPNAFFEKLGLISIRLSLSQTNQSRRKRVTLPTGEPDAGNPPVRFGEGPGRMACQFGRDGVPPSVPSPAG